MQLTNKKNTMTKLDAKQVCYLIIKKLDFSCIRFFMSGLHPNSKLSPDIVNVSLQF